MPLLISIAQKNIPFKTLLLIKNAPGHPKVWLRCIRLILFSCLLTQHYFANKGPSSQGYGFSSGHVWMWELDYKSAECQRIDAFELWCWRRLLRVPWTARRSNQSILKEISSECSLEEQMLKLKPQYCGHLTWKLTHLKKPWYWERLKVGGEGDNRG